MKKLSKVELTWAKNSNRKKLAFGYAFLGFSHLFSKLLIIPKKIPKQIFKKLAGLSLLKKNKILKNKEYSPHLNFFINVKRKISNEIFSSLQFKTRNRRSNTSVHYSKFYRFFGSYLSSKHKNHFRFSKRGLSMKTSLIFTRSKPITTPIISSSPFFGNIYLIIYFYNHGMSSFLLHSPDLIFSNYKFPSLNFNKPSELSCLLNFPKDYSFFYINLNFQRNFPSFFPNKNINNLSYARDFALNDPTVLSKNSSFNTLWSNFQNSLFFSNLKNTSTSILFVSLGFYSEDSFAVLSNLYSGSTQSNHYNNKIFLDLKFRWDGFKNLSSLTDKFKFSFLNSINTARTSRINSFSSNPVNVLTFYDKKFKVKRLQSTTLFLSSETFLWKNNSSLKTFNSFLKFKLKKNFFSALKNFIQNYLTKFKKYAKLMKKSLKSQHSFTKNSFSTFSSLKKSRHFYVKKLVDFNSNTFNSKSYYLKGSSYSKGCDYSKNTNTTGSTLNSHFFHSPNATFLPNGYKLFNIHNLFSTPFFLKLQFSSHVYDSNESDLRFILSTFQNFFLKFSLTRSGLVEKSRFLNTNLSPNISFRFSLLKNISDSHADGVFTMSTVPWHYNSVVRFFEFCSGKKIVFQFYPFLLQSVEKYYVVLYRRWMSRMFSYERSLGHRFFMEEALHLIHLTLNLHDPKIMLLWMKSMINRLSFYKTRSIFRFLRYLFREHFYFILNDVGAKGLKICLRGKISVAGNSRTRTILFRFGKNSQANTSLKVLNEFTPVSTFTGVLGFQIWIFY